MDGDSDRQFYMGYTYRHGKEQITDFAERYGAGFLTNAHGRWSERTERFNELWTYDCPNVLDSGGYNVMSQHVDRWGNCTSDESTVETELDKQSPFYPWTIEEYHDWLHEEGDTLDWAAAMDYACEERFDVLWSVEDRVQATIENTIRQHELRERDDSDYNFLPVLQGRTVDDYVRCAEIYENAGIDISYVGLGTVCRLSSEKKIVDIEKEVRERTNVEQMHGFGVKIDAYKFGADFETADSQAWIYNASYQNLTVLKENDDGSYSIAPHEDHNTDKERKVHGFKAYYAYVNWIINDDTESMDEVFADQEELDYGPEIDR